MAHLPLPSSYLPAPSPLFLPLSSETEMHFKAGWMSRQGVDDTLRYQHSHICTVLSSRNSQLFCSFKNICYVFQKKSNVSKRGHSRTLLYCWSKCFNYPISINGTKACCYIFSVHNSQLIKAREMDVKNMYTLERSRSQYYFNNLTVVGTLLWLHVP